MKTPSIFAIVIEVILLLSLIALFVLCIAFVYAILWLLTETTPQLPQTKTPVIAPAKTLEMLPSAKPTPKLEEAVAFAEISTQAIAFAKLNVKQLKDLARKQNILNWRRLKKGELISALEVVGI